MDDDRSSRPVRRYALSNGAVTMAVSSTDEVRARLEAYFQPWLVAVSDPDHRADIHLDLRVDSTAHSTAHSTADGAPTAAPTRVVRLRNENTGRSKYADRWDDGSMIVHRLVETATWVRYRRGDRDIHVVSVDDERLWWDAKDLIQRQVLQPLMLQRASMLHSAAVTLSTGVVALAGVKGAGKSTAQLALAEAGGALTSADRTLIGADAGGLRAWGYPARTCLEPDTFRRFPQLGDTADFPLNGHKRLVPLPTAAARLGSSAVGDGPLAGILVCHRGQDRRLLDEIAPSEVGHCLEEHWFDEADPIVPPWLGLVPLADAAPERRRLLVDLLGRRRLVLACNTDRLLHDPVAALRSIDEVLGARTT